ncbi:hypothetical protein IF1G_02976 [Cordyceps javanica]|uniref:Uncharacterized protein n=1 Tax=Cordyceps javanica TaxID=43265 RepID=A0A545VAY6_9HYPO|nr:hypothetical protein IF1G_02976 [Cordyceps javanica]
MCLFIVDSCKIDEICPSNCALLVSNTCIHGAMSRWIMVNVLTWATQYSARTQVSSPVGESICTTGARGVWTCPGSPTSPATDLCTSTYLPLQVCATVAGTNE